MSVRLRVLGTQHLCHRKFVVCVSCVQLSLRVDIAQQIAHFILSSKLYKNEAFPVSCSGPNRERPKAVRNLLRILAYCHWITAALVKHLGVKLKAHLRLMMRLRMSRAVPPLPSIFS